MLRFLSSLFIQEMYLFILIIERKVTIKQSMSAFKVHKNEGFELVMAISLKVILRYSYQYLCKLQRKPEKRPTAALWVRPQQFSSSALTPGSATKAVLCFWSFVPKGSMISCDFALLRFGSKAHKINEKTSP